MSSISKKTAKDGATVYRIRVFLGRDENGKQIYKNKNWKAPKEMSEKKAYKEAQAQAALFEKECKKISLTEEKERKEKKDSITLKEYIDTIWVPSLTECDYRPTTIEFKKRISKVIANSNLGKKQLSKIAKNDVEKFFEENKPLKSQKTLRHYSSTLNLIFKYAIKQKLILDNPLNNIAPLPLKKKAVDAFTTEEVEEFLDFIENMSLRLRLMYILILTTGLRRGEVFGLRWCDIDMKGHLIRVAQNVTYADKKIHIGEVKTATGENRQIPLVDYTYELILQFQKEEKESRENFKKTDYLFHTKEDPTTPQNPQYITKRMPKDLKKIDSLPNISPHDLRHTCGTQLILSGADVKSVQDILGHADASTTLNYYVKGDINKMRDAVDKAFKLD